MVDYRPVDRMTVVDKKPLPTIDEMLDRVGDASYQARLAFVVPQDLCTPGAYRANRIPKQERHVRLPGDTVRALQFLGCVQKTMDYIFHNMRQFAGAYIDDILDYTKTLAEHVPALRYVYDKLRVERFFAGPDKCYWVQL